METELKASVKAWLAAEWPFKNAVLPGIDISMEEWEKQEDQKR